jgi:hypothetical protein
MRASSIKHIVLAGALAAAHLAGCKSTLGSGSGGSGSPDAAAVGVWGGTDSMSGLGITALINSDGQATFIRTDGVQFAGSVQVSANTLAATVDGYTDFPAAFSDGSTYGIGTVNGTVTTGSSISATLTFTTNGGTAQNGTWSLNLDPLSNNSSSTTAVSGNYTDDVTGTVLSINSGGVMISQNATNGCVLNGSITTHDGGHNVYEVAYSYGNCTGTYAVLDGVQFTGLATLNPNVSPAQLTVAVTGASSTNKYGIVSILHGS